MGKMGKITHARVRNKKKSEHEIKKKVYIIIFLNIRKVYFFFWVKVRYKLAITEVVPDLIWTPDFFGPQDI